MYFFALNIAIKPIHYPREESEEYSDYINKLADNYNIEISKYVYKSDKDIYVYTTDTNLGNEINLFSGEFPEKQSKEFISNLDTNDKNQVGKFKAINKEIGVHIYNLSNESNYNKEGIYHISTQNDMIIAKIIEELNENVATCEVIGKYQANYNIDFESIINIILVFICILVAITYYAINKGKEIGILSINGIADRRISIKLIIELFNPLLFSMITSYIIIFMYNILINNSNYITKFSLYFIIMSFSVISIYLFFYFVFSSIRLYKINKIKVINGYKNYTVINLLSNILKFIFIVFTAFYIAKLSNNLNIINKELLNYSEWDKAQNIYSLPVSYLGESDTSTELKNNRAMKELYSKLEDDNQGFIINCDNYKFSSSGEYLYEKNIPKELQNISPLGKSITISENYLKFNLIKSVDSTILEQINHSDTTLNILVPIKFKESEEKIKLLFLDNFYFQKIKVQNIYNERLNTELNDTKKEELKINIIYVENNQSYFTFNKDIESENNNKISDPIVIIDSKNIDESFYSAYMTRSIYFYSEKNSAFDDVSTLINESNLTSSFSRVKSLYDDYGAHIKLLRKYCEKIVLYIIILIISNIILIYNLISIYYERNKLTIFVKSIFGYSFIRVNLNFLINISLVNLLAIIFCKIVFYINLRTYIFIFLIEYIFLFITSKKIYKKSFNSIVKGEH